MKKGALTREVVFFVILAIIIVATIVIILCMNNGENTNVNVGTNEENKINLDVEVNPDAKPESNPSIGGADNVKEVNGEKVNKSSKLKTKKVFDVYTLDNISLASKGRGTVITGTLTTTLSSKVSGKDAIIKFYDNNMNLVSQMDTYIPQVKAGESVKFRTETTSDVSNAYDFEIELK